MKVPKYSTLFSSAHNAYDQLSTTIANMAEPSDHEEELWTQFETSARSVVDAFKKYANFETPSATTREAHEALLMKVRGECNQTNLEIR